MTARGGRLATAGGVGERALEITASSTSASQLATPGSQVRLDRRLALVHEALLSAGSGLTRRIDLSDVSFGEGARIRDAVAQLAARLGYVALCTRELEDRPDLVAALSGRSVVALHDGAEFAGMSALAHVALAGARLAAVVRVGATSAVSPDLARDAAGWGAWDDAARQGTAEASRFAVRGARRVLLIPGAARFGTVSSDAPPADPVAARLARRLDRAARLFALRRGAAARRELRAVVELGEGAPSRAALAARAGVALAGQWLDEAQPGQAAREARRAATSARRGGDGRALVAAGLLLGHALLDLARPGEAEWLFGALLESVREAGDAIAAAAATATARCLLWQGQVERAWQLLKQPLGPVHEDGLATLLRWRARVALARGELAEAGRLIGGCAGSPSPAPATTSAGLLSAELARRTGRLDVSAAMLAEMARAVPQSPVVALGVKVACLRLHVAAEAGDTGETARLAASAARLGRGLAAPLLAARLDVALEAAGRRRATRARALAEARGLPALLDTPTGGSAVLDDVLEVLSVCHESGADLDALTRLCEVLRARLDAASVRVAAGESGRMLGTAGGPTGPSALVVQRAMTSGRLVEPAPLSEAVEAAVPVRFAGEVLAVIGCRWPADAIVDPARAGALLTAAAAAAGPFVQDALDRASQPVAGPAGDDLGLVGTSPVMERLRDAVRRAAPVGFPVLVMGESGSGKELVARAIHRLGARRQRRCCAVNCAALTDDLLEAELFGHARGAFTGAVSERPGLFEEADGGTLFLDEVGELSARAQAKLLRVLQEGEVRRVGETLPRRVDVRVIGATNRAIEQEVELGRFRADLRYRLDVLRVTVPPLRDRPEDIPLLAVRFWDECAARAGSQARLDPKTIDALVGYHWPGNVRELQNVMATLAVQAPRRGRVGPHLLPRRLDPSPREQPGTLDEARRRFDAAFVRDALHRTGGRRGETARQLGLSRQGLIKLMIRLGLEPDPPPGRARSGRRGGAAA